MLVGLLENIACISTIVYLVSLSIHWNVYFWPLNGLVCLFKWLVGRLFSTLMGNVHKLNLLGFFIWTSTLLWHWLLFNWSSLFSVIIDFLNKRMNWFLFLYLRLNRNLFLDDLLIDRFFLRHLLRFFNRHRFIFTSQFGIFNWF